MTGHPGRCAVVSERRPGRLKRQKVDQHEQTPGTTPARAVHHPARIRPGPPKGTRPCQAVGRLRRRAMLEVRRQDRIRREIPPRPPRSPAGTSIESMAGSKSSLVQSRGEKQAASRIGAPSTRPRLPGHRGTREDTHRARHGILQRVFEDDPMTPIIRAPINNSRAIRINTKPFLKMQCGNPEPLFTRKTIAEQWRGAQKGMVRSLKRMAWSHCSTRRGNNGVFATLSMLHSQQYCIHAGQSGFKSAGFLLQQWFDPAGQTSELIFIISHLPANTNTKELITEYPRI
jgi:hypothetical protein